MIFFNKVKSSSNETLLTYSKKGVPYNHGKGVSVVISKGTNYSIVPMGEVEVEFSIKQQTSDGILLRFSGIVNLEVTDPVIAASRFNFSNNQINNKDNDIVTIDSENSGKNELVNKVRKIVLGLMRIIAAKTSMEQALNQREKLSVKLSESAIPIIEGTSVDVVARWGIRVVYVEVQQVEISSDEIFGLVQAESHDRYRVLDQNSKIVSETELQETRIENESIIATKKFEQEKKNLIREKENIILKKEVQDEELRIAHEIQMKKEKNKIEIESLKEREKIEKEKENLEAAHSLEMFIIKNSIKEAETRKRLVELEEELNEIEVRKKLLYKAKVSEIKKSQMEILPDIAKGLSGMLSNSKINIYGDENSFLNSASEFINLIAENVRDSMT